MWHSHPATVSWILLWKRLLEAASIRPGESPALPTLEVPAVRSSPPLPGSPPAAGSTKGETSPNLLSAPNFSKKQLKMSKTVFPGYVINGGPEGLTRVEFYGFVRRKKRTQLPKPAEERHSKHWWPLSSVVSALMTWNRIHWWHCCRQQHRRMLLFAVAELILIVS